MTKIMGVRLAVKKPYLEDRLAGRAGLALQAPAMDYDPGAGRRPASHPLPLWVLPRHPIYTGAEGADVVSLRNFLTAFSCFFGFGSVIWAYAR